MSLKRILAKKIPGMAREIIFTLNNKNLQFLPNHYETLSKKTTHKCIILTKFRNDWVKIVDFLIKSILLSEYRFSLDILYLKERYNFFINIFCTYKNIKKILIWYQIDCVGIVCPGKNSDKYFQVSFHLSISIICSSNLSNN